MNKVFLMAIFSTLSIQASSIKIGYIQFSPYIYKDSKGVLKGKIVRYANKLFNEKNIIWKPTPLKRVSRSLDENRIDIFVSFFKSPQREKEVEFPKTPYLTMRPTLCGKTQDMPENLDSFDFIKDKTISFVSGTIIKDKFFGGKNINFVEIKIAKYRERTISMLLDNKLQYSYYGDNTSIVEYISKDHSTLVKCLALPIPPFPVFMVTKKKNPLIKVIEEKIEKYGPLH